METCKMLILIGVVAILMAVGIYFGYKLLSKMSDGP